MKHRFVFHSLLLLAVFLALAPTALASSTWYVDGVNGSDNNNCKSPQTACKTIGHAVSLAHSRDSVMVAPATYRENLTIGFSLKVIGSAAATTLVDGGGLGTVVTIPSTGAHVALSKLTIFNGVAHGSALDGGGIYNSGTLTISNSTIAGNSAGGYSPGNGGGIYNSGTLTISNSTIINNSAGGYSPGSGGGIYNIGALTISANSTISGNIAKGHGVGDGGGIYNLGTLTVSNSTISGNGASGGGAGSGGGISNGGPLTINDSTVSGNFAGGMGSSGGGIGNRGGLTINNSTVTGNSAGCGGGISNGGTLTMNNSTISGNSAGLCGHRQGSVIDNGGTSILQNTIVANKGVSNCGGTITSHGYNLSSDSTCNFSNTGDLNNTDPKLGQLGNYGGPTQTIPLLSGSPAIDAGNPSGCTDGQGHLLKTDQRGRPRHDKEDNGGCDMGAYERRKD
jgi:hypothetical protein